MQEAAVAANTPGQETVVDASAQDAAVEDRRRKVRSLYLRHVTVKAMAGLLGESEATITADLDWFTADHANRFGPSRMIDPSQEIGWGVADFEEMESACWKEFYTLAQEAKLYRLSPALVGRVRQGWLRTAAMMRVLRLKLLAEHNFLQPAPSRYAGQSSVLRADELRVLLRQEGLLLEVSEARQRKTIDLVAEPPAEEEDLFDPSRWMEDGGFSGS